MSGCQIFAWRRRASWTSRLSKGGSSSRRSSACSMSSTPGMNLRGYLSTLPSVDQLALHARDRDPPRGQAEGDDDGEVKDVDPALEAEDRVAHQLHAVVERVEVRRDLRPLGEFVDR